MIELKKAHLDHIKLDSKKLNNKKYALSLDLGGTTFKMGIFDLKEINKLLFTTSVKAGVYSPEKPNKFIDDIKNEALKFIKASKLDIKDFGFVGVSFGGAMYPGDKLCFGNNKFDLPDKFPVVENLQKAFNLETIGLNDSRSAIFGEYFAYYYSKNLKSVLGYTIGTSVGGCIIIDGKIYPGAHNHAAEVGHGSSLNESKVTCFCGLPGCMAAHSSAVGARCLLKEDVEFNPSPLRNLRNQLKRDLELKDLCEFIQETDNLYAKNFLAKLFKSFANSLSYLIFVLDPSVVLIGGTPAKSSKVMGAAIKGHLEGMLWPEYIKDSPVHFCNLKGYANLFGIFYYGLNELKYVIPTAKKPASTKKSTTAKKSATTKKTATKKASAKK